MNILLFGKNGQVGWELNRSLQLLGKVTATSREDIDFSDGDSLRKLLKETRPDIIVNAVAYTAVDAAESEPLLAEQVNEMSPQILAQEAFVIGALLVHYSTDYVFDGTKDSPYLETDIPAPVNTYGRTKLGGEKRIEASGCDYIIFRTSWVYAARGHNFLHTILRLARERESLKIVGDQIGAPTSARLIADATLACLHQVIQARTNQTFTSELYHLSASSHTSWYGFAKSIIALEEQRVPGSLKVNSLDAISTEEYPTPATRPKNSRLNLDKIQKDFGINLPAWDDALSLCLEQI